MFIKKDLRKIHQIMQDTIPSENDNIFLEIDESSAKRVKREVLTELNLSRRIGEFQGSLHVLCQPSYAPSLQRLVRLSIYDCNIQSLEGIGFLGSNVEEGRGKICCPFLESLNVGRNPLKYLPDELCMLSRSLKELWCDDCQIHGPLPPCIVKLDNLEKLHMAHNCVLTLPSEISNLKHMKELCLDHNKLRIIPSQIKFLERLEILLLGHNQLQVLPELPTQCLKLLHVSSNQLVELPKNLSLCSELQQLVANQNRLTKIPSGIESLPMLQRLNLSHNQIDFLPLSFSTRYGDPDRTTGLCQGDVSCIVYVGQNRLGMKEDQLSVQKSSTRAKLTI
jgi:Leucine-rich repeat (LRR) protein